MKFWKKRTVEFNHSFLCNDIISWGIVRGETLSGGGGGNPGLPLPLYETLSHTCIIHTHNTYTMLTISLISGMEDSLLLDDGVKQLVILNRRASAHTQDSQ